MEEQMPSLGGRASRFGAFVRSRSPWTAFCLSVVPMTFFHLAFWSYTYNWSQALENFGALAFVISASAAFFLLALKFAYLSTHGSVGRAFLEVLVGFCVVVVGAAGCLWYNTFYRSVLRVWAKLL